MKMGYLFNFFLVIFCSFQCSCYISFVKFIPVEFFDTTVNGIFLISNTDYSLLVHRETGDFSLLILYAET